MTKQYTQFQLFELQRKASLGVELLNETVTRVVKEITDAVRKAYDDGKPLEGLSFDLVFVAKPEPVASVPAVPVKAEEVEDDETEEEEEAEDETDDDEVEDEADDEEADEKPAKKAVKKPAKKSKKSK